MAKSWVQGVLIAIGAILLMGIGAILLEGVLAGGPAGGTLSTGRTIMTHSDSFELSSSFSADTATIQTAGKTIVVEPERLFVNGSKVAEINPAVSDIEVHVKHGAITFIADGKTVPTTLR